METFSAIAALDGKRKDGQYVLPYESRLQIDECSGKDKVSQESKRIALGQSVLSEEGRPWG